MRRKETRIGKRRKGKEKGKGDGKKGQRSRERGGERDITERDRVCMKQNNRQEKKEADEKKINEEIL